MSLLTAQRVKEKSPKARVAWGVVDGVVDDEKIRTCDKAKKTVARMSKNKLPLADVKYL